jgi:prepilin-type N-terminal cleavage/methylation domain-containing protein
MAIKLRQSGYTIIELLTVVVITSVLSLTAVQILFQGQLRSTQSEGLNKMRQEGNFVLDALTYQLRSSLDAECVSPDELLITTQDGRAITYNLMDLSPTLKAVASDSAALTTADVNVESLLFTCDVATENAGTLVTVDITLSVPELSSTITDFDEVFSTSVYVRSFN